MAKKKVLTEADRKNVVYYIADYGGVGIIRTIFPNLLLNNLYFTRRAYGGIVSTRFIADLKFLNNQNYVRFQRQVDRKSVV